MILTYSQREAIKHLAHNLTPTTLAAIVAELDGTDIGSLVEASEIFEAAGVNNCGSEEFDELVTAAIGPTPAMTKADEDKMWLRHMEEQEEDDDIFAQIQWPYTDGQAR